VGRERKRKEYDVWVPDRLVGMELEIKVDECGKIRTELEILDDRTKIFL
jgi:hypothetical protein